MSSENKQKTKKITLRGYYNDLPEATHPKTDFINEIASLTGVSTASVRNWIMGMRPQNPNHIDILSEVTGIPKSELWTE